MDHNEPDIPFSSLPGYESVSDVLSRKSECGCTLVQEFTVFYTPESLCHLTIVFVHDRNDTEGVQFSFEDIAGLEIHETHQISGLAIRYMRNRGWESSRYQVYDCEGNAIGFYCRRISVARVKIESIDPSKPR